MKTLVQGGGIIVFLIDLIYRVFVCFKNFTHEDSTGLYQVCL